MSINFKIIREIGCVYWTAGHLGVAYYDIELPEFTESGGYVLDIYDRINGENHLDIQCKSFNHAKRLAKKHYRKTIKDATKRKLIDVY
jgi:hypothetical protein